MGKHNSSQRGLGPVGWAFEDFGHLHIGPGRAFVLADDVINIGSVWFAVTNVAPCPRGARHDHAIRANNVMTWRVVWNQPVVVLFDIHDPAELELLKIVQADDGLRLASGARQSWQKK